MRFLSSAWFSWSCSELDREAGRTTSGLRTRTRTRSGARDRRHVAAATSSSSRKRIVHLANRRRHLGVVDRVRELVVGTALADLQLDVVEEPLAVALLAIKHSSCYCRLWFSYVSCCGKQRNGTTHQFLDPADIFDGLGRQIRPGTGIGGRLLPAFDRLIDRHHPGLGALAGRQMVDFLAVQHVAGADLDRVEAVENIELGQRQAVDAAGADGLPHQHGIEPAAAALAPGVDAELLAAAADLLADLVVSSVGNGPWPTRVV